MVAKLISRKEIGRKRDVRITINITCFIVKYIIKANLKKFVQKEYY